MPLPNLFVYADTFFMRASTAYRPQANGLPRKQKGFSFQSNIIYTSEVCHDMWYMWRAATQWHRYTHADSCQLIFAISCLSCHVDDLLVLLCEKWAGRGDIAPVKERNSSFGICDCPSMFL